MAIGRVRVITVAAGVASLLATAPRAATIDTVDVEGTPFITVSGRLEPGDGKRFAEEALLHDKAVVLFAGPGGNLKAGMDIGRTIRIKGFATAVPEDKMCASACALAWLGGTKRIMSEGAMIGFHAASTQENGQRVTTSAGNALVGAYLAGLGFSELAIYHITATSHEEMDWLTMAKANAVGIEVSAMPSTARKAAPRPRTETPEEDWSTYGEWVQIASRETLDEAVEVAEDARRHNANINVFRYENGWYGVVVGPFTPGRGRKALDAMVEADEIPADSLLTRGQKFRKLAWGSKPPRRMTAER